MADSEASNATVRIADRYRGFPGIAMGGFAGGLLAQRIGSEAEVTFRRPIPTDDALSVVDSDDGAELRIDGDVAATATATTVAVDLPDRVSLADAEAATRSYPGHRTHPYPSCFTCGPDRPEGDGLRVFPAPVGDGSVEDGPVEGGPVGIGSLVAAAWTPHPNHADADGVLPPEIVWSAVDCSSIWPVIEAAPPDSEEHVVSGRLAVRLDAPLRAGEPYVVAAWPLESPDGKRLSAAAVLDESGGTRAVARHTLVVTDWGVPLGVANWDGGE